MDSDPFAVWSDPAPAPASSASTSSATKIQAGSSPSDALDAARLSLEYQDEDPGWGAPSASTSRANSPEKSRKQVPVQAPADISPAVEGKTLTETVAVDSAAEETVDAPHASNTAVIETAAGQDEVDEEITAGAPVKQSSTEDAAPEKSDTSEKTRQVHTEHAKESNQAEAYPGNPTISTPAEADEEEDAFDDFGAPSGTDASGAAHDDFGDFDDFETSNPQDVDDFDDDDFGDGGFDEPAAKPTNAALSISTPAPASSPAHTRTWKPLEVTSNSNRIDLAESVTALLPLSTAAEKDLTTGGLRQVEGLSQVLVSESSRQLWADLSSFPSVRPIDWVRSRTRRDYLISMGVPVNLDEIHSSFASGSGGSRQLPPLQLKYDSSAHRDSNGSGLQRSSSLNVGGTNPAHRAAAQRSASTSNSPRDGSSSPALGSSTNRELIAERRMQELGLGPAPQVDLRRAQELVNKTEDQLTLLSLPALKSLLRELNTLTTSTSSLLTHHLTLRESYQADSEMYNSMIKELVTGAASRFSGGGGGGSGSNSVSGGRGDSRRTTLMGASASSSGKARASRLPAEPAVMSGTRSMSPSMSPSLRGGAASAPRR